MLSKLKYIKSYYRYEKNKLYRYIKMRRYRRRFGSVGENLMLSKGVKIRLPERLFLGNNVSMNNDVWINAHGQVEIGNYVIIGPKVVIHSANHKFDRLDIPIQKQGHVVKPVIIEEDVWIGASAVILPGVRIGKGSVIGAGSVVTKDIPAYSVAMGVPATVKSSRK